MAVVASLLLAGLLLGGVSGQDELSNRNTDFAVRLFRSAVARSDDNVLLSVVTLSAAMTTLVNNTEGTARDQLTQSADLLQTLSPAPSGLKQGVAYFPSSDITVTSSYQEVLQAFGCSAQTVDYSAGQDAEDSINSWAQGVTGEVSGGKELVTGLQPDTKLLLAAAAAYTVQFSPSFNASLTTDERFYVDRYHVAMVPMMLRSGKFALAYDRSVSAGVLKLTAADGAAMLVVLPDEGVALGDLEQEVTGEKIKAWIRSLKKTKLEVQLPRFVMERSYWLRDVMQNQLEIKQVFQDDVISMGGARGPGLTQLVHRAAVSVGEGSDDITGGGASSSLPPRLSINRPFLFLLYQEATGRLMLIGRVIDPTRK